MFWGNENWFDKSGVQDIGSKTILQCSEKQYSVQIIGGFKKAEVQKIGIPLHVDNIHSV